MERKIHERNKKYGRLLIVAALNWLMIGLMIWKVDPEQIRNVLFPESFLPMIILVAGGVFWLLSILFLSAKQALRWTLGFVLFLYLRIWGLGSMLNGILILGLLVCWEIYFRKGKKENGNDNDVQ